jgi:uncharacterized membrane protein
VWWIALANEDLMIWSIILFFISFLTLFTIILILIFDLQKRLEKLELIYKIKKIEGDPIIENLEVKVVSLNNWEKRIINLLKKNDGELTQVELRRLTGLSRSNLSKHLNLLDEKEIIQKTPHKRTNKVFLIKNIIN